MSYILGLHGSDKEDEIRAIDWWRIIFRRKYYLMGIWGIAILSAFGYLVATEPIYESKVLIHIGKIKDVGYLEEPEVLRERLEIESENNCSEGRYPCLYGSELNDKKNNLSGQIMILTAHGRTRSEAEVFINQVLTRLISEHEKLYQAAVMPMLKQYEALQQHISGLEMYVKSLSTYIEKFINDDPLPRAHLILEQSKLVMEIWNMKKNAEKLHFAISEPESSQTKIIGEPLVSDVPIKPRYKMILILSCGLGLVFGLFGVFIAEFIANTQKQLSVIQKG